MYKRIWLLAGLLLVGGRATAQDHPFRIDPSTDFSKFRTYAWDQSANSQRVTNQADTQITAALEDELAGKDLKKTALNAANLSICYHSNFDTKQIKRYTMLEGEGSYSWTIKTGEIAVDMFDSSTKKLIWHNTAEFNPQAKPQHIAKAVSNLLKDFPPKRK